MKKLKSILAVVLVLAMSLSMTACGGADVTWAFKSENDTVPIGVYLYYQYAQYNQALTQLDSKAEAEAETESETEEVSSKPEVKFENDTIKGESATEWVNAKAEELCKEYIMIDRLMEKYNLTLSTEDNNKAKSQTESVWSSVDSQVNKTYGDILEGYGISKDSYNKAVNLLSVKKTLIFEAIYGEGGEKEVTTEEIEQYMLSDYVNIDYIYVLLFDTSTGSYVFATEEQTQQYKDALENVKKSIADGVDFATATADFATEYPDFNPMIGSTVSNNLDESGFTATTTEGVKKMSIGDVEIFDDGSALTLIHKKDINDAKDEVMDNSTSVSQLLTSFKGDEFTTMYEEESEKIELTSKNDSTLKKYQPKRYE